MRAYFQKANGKRVCESKVKYPSKELAWKAAKRLKIGVYSCYWGDHYHLSSRFPNYP